MDRDRVGEGAARAKLRRMVDELVKTHLAVGREPLAGVVGGARREPRGFRHENARTREAVAFERERLRGLDELFVVAAGDDEHLGPVGMGCVRDAHFRPGDFRRAPQEFGEGFGRREDDEVPFGGRFAVVHRQGEIAPVGRFARPRGEDGGRLQRLVRGARGKEHGKRDAASRARIEEGRRKELQLVGDADLLLGERQRAFPIDFKPERRVDG